MVLKLISNDKFKLLLRFIKLEICNLSKLLNIYIYTSNIKQEVIGMLI